MARLKIELPNKFAFSTDIPIRIDDINRGWHLSNTAVLAILEEARVQFLSRLGYAEQGNKNAGVGFIMADAGIIYKRQGYYGQTLKVEIAAADFTAKSFDFLYRVSDAKSETEIARAKTCLVAFNYQAQKMVPVPNDLKSKFTGPGI